MVEQRLERIEKGVWNFEWKGNSRSLEISGTDKEKLIQLAVDIYRKVLNEPEQWQTSPEKLKEELLESGDDGLRPMGYALTLNNKGDILTVDARNHWQDNEMKEKLWQAVEMVLGYNFRK